MSGWGHVNPNASWRHRCDALPFAPAECLGRCIFKTRLASNGGWCQNAILRKQLCGNTFVTKKEKTYLVPFGYVCSLTSNSNFDASYHQTSSPLATLHFCSKYAQFQLQPHISEHTSRRHQEVKTRGAIATSKPSHHNCPKRSYLVAVNKIVGSRRLTECA